MNADLGALTTALCVTIDDAFIANPSVARRSDDIEVMQRSVAVEDRG